MTNDVKDEDSHPTESSLCTRPVLGAMHTAVIITVGMSLTVYSVL